MKLTQPLRKICIYFSDKDFSKPSLCDTAIWNRLFQISLYISSALLALEIYRDNHYSDFEDHFWYQAFLSFSPLLWGQWAEGSSELCKGAALSWLGSWRKDKPQSPVRHLHLYWPLQFPRFQWTAGKSSCLPALTPAPHKKKKQPWLCCQSRRRKKGESTRKGRTHLESTGERWMLWKELQSWQKP